MKKVLVLLAAVTLLLGFTACGKQTKVDITETTAETAAPSEATQATTAETASSAELTMTQVVTQIEETSIAAESTASPTSTVPTTTQEILDAYTDVMTYAKTVHAGFTRVMYQSLPKEKRNFSNNTVLNIASNFMTTKEKAEKKPSVYPKGNDGEFFPVYGNKKGCLLTDVNAIQSAECKRLSNGNYQIKIVLKPEINPEPTPFGAAKAPSYHGAMFGPASKSVIDDAMNSKIVTSITKSATYSLKYFDSFSLLEYNPNTKRIQSLYQHCNVLISADAELIFGDFKGNCVLLNDNHFSDFKY